MQLPSIGNFSQVTKLMLMQHTREGCCSLVSRLSWGRGKESLVTTVHVCANNYQQNVVRRFSQTDMQICRTGFKCSGLMIMLCISQIKLQIHISQPHTLLYTVEYTLLTTEFRKNMQFTSNRFSQLKTCPMLL